MTSLKAFSFLLALLGAALGTGCSSYLVVRGGVVNSERVLEVKQSVTALRGLSFLAEVPIEVKSRDEIRRALEATVVQDYGEEKLENLSLIYGKLGLLPQGLNLKKVLLGFVTEQLAGFYDARAKKLFLPADITAGAGVGTVQFLARKDIVGGMVLAHELTHALQDQHFGLEDKLAPSGSDDRALAFRAVIEGDATVVGFAHLYGVLDEKSLAAIMQVMEASMGEARKQFADVPEAIVTEILFQYYGGVSFVARFLAGRGWLGVNRIYSHPPLSTEQVLHPEKYVDLPDPPTAIKLGELRGLFPGPWREVESNSLGELMTEVLFRQFVSAEEAARVAQGWDGDRLVAFRRENDVAFVWASVWDTEEDAREFAEKYREILARKYPDGGSAHSYLERRGARVIVVEGVERSQAERQIEHIWGAAAFNEEPFKPPFPPLRKAAEP